MMIKAAELRIGNYFHPSSRAFGLRIPIETITHRVGAINCFGEIEVIEAKRKETLVFNTNEIEPIPLTTEILEACGFEKKTIDQGYNIIYRIPFKTFWFTIYDHSGRFCFVPFEVNHEVEITTLHQLQNLYFALTAKELTFSLSNPNTPAQSHKSL